MQTSNSLRAAILAAAFALAAAPAIAQSAAGPVRDPSPGDARLAGRVVRVRGADSPSPALPAVDATGDFARQVQPSRPHLYASMPLSALLGLGGAVLGYGAGFVLLDCSDEGSTCNNGPDNAEYLTAATGLALGAATGAHFGGLRRDSRGSLGLTLLGAFAGTLPLILAPKAGDVDTASLVSLAAAPAGAVLVDYAARRPRH